MIFLILDDISLSNNAYILDVALNLSNGKYLPYNKLDNTPLHIYTTPITGPIL